MESGTLIAFLIIVVGCILLVILVNRKKKNKDKRFVQTLFDFAERSNCKISEYDLWNNTLIGIDKGSHKLFFIRETEDNAIINEIDLFEIQKCKVINSSRIVNNKVSAQNVIDKLELLFTFRDSKKPETYLEFYNTNRDNLFMNGELSLIEKWLETVNKSMAGIVQK
jgi:hypothetical protein